MNAARLGGFLVFLMDFIALGALFSTREVRNEILVPVTLLLILSRLRTFPLSNGVLAGFLGLTITGTFVSWMFFKVPLILAVAHSTPLLHATLWLGRGFDGSKNRERTWRIAVGFVELNVTAVLSSEFYIALMIFLFSLIAAVALSVGFLHETIIQHESEQKNQPVLIPRSFLAYNFVVSFFILLTSFFIFPFLPRIQNGPGEGGTSTVGYTEQVNLSQMTSLLGSGGGGTAMLLYFPEGNAGEKSRNQHIATDIYLGLLRGRSLSQFDGRTWKADEPQLTIQRGQKRSVASDQQEAKNGDIVELEAIRTPLGSTTLPIPYGTSRVLIRNPEGVMTAPVQIASGEWMDPAGSDHPVNYRLVVDHSRSAGFGSDSTDLPAEKHLEIPTIVKTKRMQTLARRIFPPGLNTAEKITRLQNFFTQEKFMAFTGDNGEDNGAEIDGQMTAFQNLQPIEKFLFLSKKGHCELFSGAAAILLRMAGVPTRMIAGFRISRAPMGDVLNVRSGDGHAWIEYWIPEKGWKALDLTPRFMFAPSFTEYLRTIYDIASAVWYRNITGNESPLQFLKLKDYFNLQALKSSKAEGYISRAQGHIERWAAEEKSTLLWILVYAVALAVCVFLVIRTWFPWILSIRWRVNEGPGWIKQERLRMEQFLVRKLYKRWIHHPATGMDFECAAHDLRILYGEQAAECFGVWRKTYLSARFGKISVYRKEVRSQLRSRYRELQQILGKRGEREDRRGNSDGDSDNPHKAG